jgi:hypothetical protein
MEWWRTGADKIWWEVYRLFRDLDRRVASQCGWLLLVYCLAYSSTLKIEARCSSVASRSLGITRHYNPEDVETDSEVTGCGYINLTDSSGGILLLVSYDAVPTVEVDPNQEWLMS